MNHLKISFALLLVPWSVLLPACAEESPQSFDKTDTLLPGMFLLMSDESVYSAGNRTYVDLFNDALNTWDIALETNRLGRERDTTPGNRYNPPHWLTATGDDCRGSGVPGQVVDYCPFTPPSSVIGVCYFRFYSDGELIDTTAMVRKGFVNNAYRTHAESLEVAVHEIGHCIGMRHVMRSDYVMYPYANGVRPHAEELAAAAYVYTADAGGPAATTRNPIDPHSGHYFSPGGGNFIRHFEFPTFVIAGELAAEGYHTFDRGLTAPRELTPLDPARGPVTQVAFYLYADGSERMVPFQ